MYPTALPFLLLLLGPATAALLTPLHQFPNGTSVENLAIRPNGAILLTLLYSAQILQIAPPTPNATTTTTTTTPVPALIHTFPNTTTRVNGIAELTPDTYAIAANHNTIWTLDLTHGTTPTVAKIATIPAARFLNGIATLNATARTVLVADSTAGVVWRVDTATGRYGVALRDDTLAPPANVSSGGLALGVNGVRYDGDGEGGYVYYTNTGKALFCRVAVDPATGEATGPYETIVEGFAGDDLAVGDGAAFVASSGSGGVVEKVWFGDGAREVVAGGVAGATSVAFGRGEGDKDVLYVTTSGGGLGGGKVVAVEGL